MSHNNLHLSSALVGGIFCAGLFVVAGPVQAYNGFLKDFSDLYPESRTGQAGCTTCHVSGGSTLNAYGHDLCATLPDYVPGDAKPYLMAIEALNSDDDPSMATNRAEIDAHAQPGWTTGEVNKVYAQCVFSGALVAPPSDVPLPYDPPGAGMPVAVPGGPYTGLVDVPLVFDGTGSFDSDDGEITSWFWDFGDGSMADQATASHTYTAADTFIVTLTVVDNDGNSSTSQTSATITAGTALDLDITALSVSKNVRVGKSIGLKLAVQNTGSAPGQSLATIVGMQNGSEVYRWRLNVFDDLGGGSTTFIFPAYTPNAAGTISWTAVIDDGDPDRDEATATTMVK